MKKRYRVLGISKGDAYYEDSAFIVGRTGTADIVHDQCIRLFFDEPFHIGSELYTEALFLPNVELAEILDPEQEAAIAEWNEYDQEE